eukprot:sb/3464999/
MKTQYASEERSRTLHDLDDDKDDDYGLRDEISNPTDESDLPLASLEERDGLSTVAQRSPDYEYEDERDEYCDWGYFPERSGSREYYGISPSHEEHARSFGNGYCHQSAIQEHEYRRSLSFHDIGSLTHDFYEHQEPEEDFSSADGVNGEDHGEGEGFFEDDLLPATSYYVDNSHWLNGAGCGDCTDLTEKLAETELQVSYLNRQLDDKNEYLNSVECELEQVQAYLRSLKLGKDISEYEQNQKHKLVVEKLNATEQCLTQKDKAYMDLLERFVSLEQSYQHNDELLKHRTRECSLLSDRLSAVEFDLMIAEEQLQKGERRGASSGDKKQYNHVAEEKSDNGTANLEDCSLDQQPLVIPLSDDDLVEEKHLKSIRKTKIEAEKHAKIQKLLTGSKKVSAYELFKITQEMAEMNCEDDFGNKSV